MPETVYGLWEGDPTTYVENEDGSATAHFHNGTEWIRVHPAEVFTKSRVMDEASFMAKHGHLLPIPANALDHSGPEYY